MPLGRYTVLTTIGTIPWYFGLAAIGVAVGASWESFHESWHYADYAIAALILAGLAFLGARMYRKRLAPPRHGVRVSLGRVFALVLALAALTAPGALAHHPGAMEEDAARGLQYDGLRPASDDGPCRGVGYEITVGVNISCTHGPDPAPEGVDVRESPSLEELRARTDAAAPVPCIGDGTSGERVQAVYAYPVGQPNRIAALRPLIESWASETNDIVRASAAQQGGTRDVRFVTTGCVLDIKVFSVPTAAAGGDFGDTITSLVGQGLTASNRKYLVWMDANALCGIAQSYEDDRPSQENYNNGRAPGGLFARVDKGCWADTRGPTQHARRDARAHAHARLGALDRAEPLRFRSLHGRLRRPLLRRRPRALDLPHADRLRQPCLGAPPRLPGRRLLQCRPFGLELPRDPLEHGEQRVPREAVRPSPSRPGPRDCGSPRRRCPGSSSSGTRSRGRPPTRSIWTEPASPGRRARAPSLRASSVARSYSVGVETLGRAASPPRGVRSDRCHARVSRIAVLRPSSCGPRAASAASSCGSATRSPMPPPPVRSSRSSAA